MKPFSLKREGHDIKKVFIAKKSNIFRGDFHARFSLILANSTRVNVLEKQ